MGKIFKALEKSEKETGKLFSSASESKITSKLAPFVGTAEEKDLISIQKPYSYEAEQFRVLKNNILFPESGNPPRTIMITSTTHGEGKSFIASNLAVAIASSVDEHVLMLDCDLHNPTVHTMFGLENDKGLSTYLAHGETLSSLLKKTFLQKLTILSGGPLPSNPSELISSDKMRKLIIEAETRYEDRYILLDTPPCLTISETNALAKHVDGMILVVKHGYTKKKHIQDIIDIYGREKILGVVYNFAKDKFGFQFGNKYGYIKKG